MRIKHVIYFLLCGLFVPSAAQGQESDIVYCRKRTFRIPFQVDPGERPRLREVQLFLLDGERRNWQHYGTVGPQEDSFRFRAAEDGLFWFTVRTVDNAGRAVPASLDPQSEPGLRVVVDTTPPVVSLRTLKPAEGQVGIEWEVRDDNLDAEGMELEYRGEVDRNWRPVSIDPGPVGRKWWQPVVRGPIEVRLTAQDRAANRGNSAIRIGDGNGLSSVITPSPTRTETLAPRPDYSSQDSNLLPAGPDVKVVNQTRIPLSYSLQDVGPSGVSLVELWTTQDGRSWHRYGEDEDKTSPMFMEVNGEGTLGLTLIVLSGVGYGNRTPKQGDPPQLWIEVDTTKPLVQVLSAEPGRGPESGSLTVTWRASDKNLLRRPISLYYSQIPEGPWHAIAKNLENTGRYVWKIPPQAPYKFHVRIEANDRGGNFATADTPSPVIVDLSQPSGRLLGVDGL